MLWGAAQEHGLLTMGVGMGRRREPLGMPNKANLHCWFNAIMQCLAHCAPSTVVPRRPSSKAVVVEVFNATVNCTQIEESCIMTAIVDGLGLKHGARDPDGSLAQMMINAAGLSGELVVDADWWWPWATVRVNGASEARIIAAVQMRRGGRHAVALLRIGGEWIECDDSRAARSLGRGEPAFLRHSPIVFVG